MVGAHRLASRPGHGVAFGLRPVRSVPRHAKPRHCLRRDLRAGRGRGRRGPSACVATRHVYYGSLLAPLFGATATLAALSWSRRTGRPVLLDVAQADAASFAQLRDRGCRRGARCGNGGYGRGLPAGTAACRRGGSVHDPGLPHPRREVADAHGLGAEVLRAPRRCHRSRRPSRTVSQRTSTWSWGTRRSTTR